MRNDIGDKYSISVVIATLGGEVLSDTLSTLNQGTLVPQEILICVPEEYISSIPTSMPGNISILATKTIGQVSQRLHGLKIAKNNLVMQLDDDVHLNRDCLEILSREIISRRDMCSISPSLQDRIGARSIYSLPKPTSLLIKIYYFLISGATKPREGSILSCGLSIGCDLSDHSSDLKLVDWLPGGCVMHKRENLFLKEYYPFSGKAYCEDLIHSYWLSRQDLNLYISSRAKASIVVNSLADVSPKLFLKHLIADFKARSFLLDLRKQNKYRMYLFYALEIMIYSLRKLKLLLS